MDDNSYISETTAPVGSVAQVASPTASDRDLYALRDRADCIRLHECRSPYTCNAIDRCADTLTPDEDARLFGYGSGATATGKRPTRRK